MGGQAEVIDRLRLLMAVSMQAAPTTKAVAARLHVPKAEAESALGEAQRASLVVCDQGSRLARRLWRLSEQGRAELARLQPRVAGAVAGTNRAERRT